MKASTAAESARDVSASGIRFRGQPLWKRCSDLLIAIIATLLLLPILLATALLIQLGAGGPIFFRQTRYGALGEPFQIWKFRTLVPQADEQHHTAYVRQLMQQDGALSKLNRRTELIPLGGLLRRLTIDELPQLINVLRGEMSIVGPRPDVIPLAEYEPWQLRRFEVLPGITGLWQVSGKNNTTFTEMMELDAMYVAQRSLWLDARILMLTPRAIIRQALAKAT